MCGLFEEGGEIMCGLFDDGGEMLRGVEEQEAEITEQDARVIAEEAEGGVGVRDGRADGEGARGGREDDTELGSVVEGKEESEPL